MFFLIPGCGSQLFHKMSCKWEMSLEASCPWKVVLNFLIPPSFKSSNKYFGGMPLLWFCSLENICTGIHPCLLAANVKWVKAGIRSNEGCLVTALGQPLHVIVAVMESTSWEVEGWLFFKYPAWGRKMKRRIQRRRWRRSTEGWKCVSQTKEQALPTKVEPIVRNRRR